MVFNIIKPNQNFLGLYKGPSAVSNNLCEVFHLILTTTPDDRYYYYPQFSNEETEAPNYTASNWQV